MNVNMPDDPQFNQYYQTHLKYLKLKGLRPKTIDAYSRAIRRIGNYFHCRIDDLSSDQLLDYFNDLLDSHSWSAVKLDLYGLKFFYTNVLNPNNSLLYLETQNTVVSRLLGMVLNNFIVNPLRIMSLGSKGHFFKKFLAYELRFCR